MMVNFEQVSLSKVILTEKGQHSDYGSITLLFQDSIGGLEVLSKSGNFISAPPIPGSIGMYLVVEIKENLIWSSNSNICTNHG
jgi:isopenicillin N synthase-like dioxygenase